MTANSQTLSEIRALLTAAGLAPNRRLGQNFLIDGNLMLKVVDGAEIGPDDVVLEVGCGTGALTDHLVRRAAAVVGVEIDRGLAAGLRDRFRGCPHFELLEADVLERKSRVAQEVLDAVRRQPFPGASAPLLVANLPYSISSPLLMNLLDCGVRFARFHVVIQKEAAERILARPATRAYGPLSIMLQSCADIRRVANLPPQAFWPVPQVDSQAVRLDLHYRPFDDALTAGAMSALVRTAFAHRRKTLNYNLKTMYPPAVVNAACAATGVDPRCRAEQIDVATWQDLARRLLALAARPPCD